MAALLLVVGSRQLLDNYVSFFIFINILFLSMLLLCAALCEEKREQTNVESTLPQGESSRIFDPLDSALGSR